mmetsp:Transcript_7619/g.6824  ORF Transcript_7619/g.6824 Transcript_7619/m.6824 type:complete len:98 (-) Transcript_7619:18-311(-)
MIDKLLEEFGDNLKNKYIDFQNDLDVIISDYNAQIQILQDNSHLRDLERERANRHSDIEIYKDYNSFRSFMLTWFSCFTIFFIKEDLPEVDIENKIN